MRAAATLSLLAHAILALTLLGSYSLEASKPRAPDQVVGRICGERFQISKDDASTQIPICLDKNGSALSDPSIRSAVIVIHGRSRTAPTYHAAIENAVAAVGREDVLVLAPQFLTVEDVEAADPRPDVITWRSSDWSQGDRSDGLSSPARISSFEALDKVVEDISKRERYPNLSQIVVAGQSAGGQFVQRYAAGTRIEQHSSISSRQIQIKYIVANPSSYMYLFSPDVGRNYSTCRGIDEYKYGLEDLNTYMRATGPDGIRASYPQKDVTVLLGRVDHRVIDPSKDDSCEATAQGAHRLNRGIRFVRHLDEHFGDGNHHTRLVIVPGVGHNGRAIFNSPEGRRVLLGT